MNCANHPDRERIAFCQNCGKPLCQECMRPVGPAVYCEPCLAAKLAGATGPAAAGVYPAGAIPPIASHGAPNPLLAGFLGFIPGVGAIYNAQYFKGGVHLVVFVLFVSLADSNGLFGIFIAGWEFYMAFEAFHTARARRDGLPIPNPFGLNDLGEKLGFGKSWQSGATNPAPIPPDPYAGAYANTAAGVPVPGAAQPYAAPFATGPTQPNWGPAQAPPWQYAAPMPPMSAVPLDEQVPYPGNRFPAGALWLIGFGVLFLVANAGFFHGFSSRLFLPVFLIGLAVFVFVRKMTSYGPGFAGDGAAGYRFRVFRALRGSVWIALVGLLFFLDEFRILSWSHSWPLFIILAGLMTVLERATFSAVSAPPPMYGNPYGYAPQPPASVPPVETATAIVPTSTRDAIRDQEGS